MSKELPTFVSSATDLTIYSYVVSFEHNVRSVCSVVRPSCHHLRNQKAKNYPKEKRVKKTYTENSQHFSVNNESIPYVISRSLSFYIFL